MELDQHFYEEFKKVSCKIDPDFELSTPMMMLKHLMNLDVDIEFDQKEELLHYLNDQPYFGLFSKAFSDQNQNINED